MGRLKSARWWMGSLLVCTWAAGVDAQTCEQDTDCPKGYDCHEYVVQDACAVAPCAQGEECAMPPECKAEVRRECTPSSCDSDADCAEDMVCFEQSVEQCSGATATAAADCPPNETCTTPERAPEPQEPVCTKETISQCTPRYVLPCEQDADCGDGFTCQTYEECSCSGSSGDPGPAPEPSPTSDGGAASGSDAAFVPVPESDAGTAARDAGVDGPYPPDSGTTDSCECHDSAVKHCELRQVSCESDADCPSSFVCNTYSWGTASCAVSTDAGAAVCEPIEMQSGEEKRCEPRYDYGGLGGHAEAAADSSNGSAQATSAPSEPREAGSSDAGVSDDGAADSDTVAGGACSVNGPGQHERSGGYFVGLVLLALGLRSRRRLR